MPGGVPKYCIRRFPGGGFFAGGVLKKDKIASLRRRGAETTLTLYKYSSCYCTRGLTAQATSLAATTYCAEGFAACCTNHCCSCCCCTTWYLVPDMLYAEFVCSSKVTPGVQQYIRGIQIQKGSAAGPLFCWSRHLVCDINTPPYET